MVKAHRRRRRRRQTGFDNFYVNVWLNWAAQKSHQPSSVTKCLLFVAHAILSSEIVFWFDYFWIFLNFSTFPFHEKICLWMWIENKKNILSAKIELIQWKRKLNRKSSAKFNDKIEKIEAKKINFVNSSESNLSKLVKRLICLCKFHFIFVHWGHWVKSAANQNVRFYGFTFASSHRPRHRSAANAAMFTRYLSTIKPNSSGKLVEHFCRRMMWFHSYVVANGSMLRHVHRTHYDNYWLDRVR